MPKRFKGGFSQSIFIKPNFKQNQIESFNDFMEILKDYCTFHSNDNGREFWKLIVSSGITLIIKSEADSSTLTEQESTRVFYLLC